MKQSETSDRFGRYVQAFMYYAISAIVVLGVVACSAVKHVPDGSLLLNKVNIRVTDNDTVATEELYNYLRQTPNHKVLGFTKLQLGLYNLSGKDSTRWYNKWLRSIGQPPVIYDSTLTQAGINQLHTVMVNRGFMDASVWVDTVANHDKKRIDLTYNITMGTPHTIESFTMESDDPEIQKIIEDNLPSPIVEPGSVLDRTMLDDTRNRITSMLRNMGYFAFTKDAISFVADTIEGSKDVGLTMKINKPQNVVLSTGEKVGPEEHYKYFINHIYFVTDYNSRQQGLDFVFQDCDSVNYKDITVLYGKDRYIKPGILEEKCFIHTGKPYNATAVERTYQALSQLPILRYINIEMKPVAQIDGNVWIDAYVLLSRNKKQNVMVSVEGTNSEGDLGFGVGLTYQHRDLGNRSELFTAKFRTSYESLSGNFDGFVNNRYSEYAGELGIMFPKFKAPFLTKSFKQRSRATTQLAVTMTYQERPEYTRVIAGAGWKYNWINRSRNYTNNRTFDLVDINYVFLPHSTINFIDSIAPDNPLLRYSYEDHFIMRMGYSYYRTNRRIPTSTKQNSFEIQPSITTLRASADMAGNLLYAISSIIGQKKDDGAYKIFGIQYAQYVKGDVDYSYTRFLNSRHAVAFHVGFGIEYPYGNSSMVPFEKRYYAGGANSVRGWSARTLGPGAYDAKNEVVDFINQCGDIRFDINFEYRFKLFWVFEGALFVDAGNIWTIKNYANQPGGLFKFQNFYKEIAAGYGAGLRLDFTYFLLRFDLGMKAHNPAMNQEAWPIFHPRWKRDATFHFAVGYPF